MLDGLDLGVSLNKGRGPLDRLHMVCQRVDDRFVRKIVPAELVPVTRRGRVKGQGDVVAVVQGGSCEARGFGEGALKIHREYAGVECVVAAGPGGVRRFPERRARPSS